jgi:cytosine/adenosine deaminase-related metal-dependent hydrolase
VFDVQTGTFSAPSGILIRGGEIHAVGSGSELGEPERTLDAGGAFALPGLWDSHVHITAMTLAGDDSVRTNLSGYVRQGVLYLRDVGGHLQTLRSLRDRIRSGDLMGPEILFAGPMTERPPLTWGAYNRDFPGYAVPIEIPADVDSLVASVARAGGSHLKVFGAWDPGLFRRAVRLAHERGLKIVVDPGLPFFQDIPFDTALAAGAKSLEHGHTPWQTVLPPDLKEIHDRLQAGTDEDATVDFRLRTVVLGREAIDFAALRALGDRMVASGAYFCPTIRVMEEEWRGQGDTWDGLAAAAVEMTRALAERGVSLLVGSDGDPRDATATIREMELLVGLGVPPAQVLRAATINPARWIGRDDEIGSLTSGMKADLILVDSDPLQDMRVLRSPVLVMQDGVVRRGQNLLPPESR